MTDKERIIEEIERLKLCTMDEHMKFYCEEAEIEYNTLCRVVNLIKSLQEEPVSEDLEGAAITAADEDMQGRQIMEESNEKRQLYSRIFRRGFKAGTNWQKAKDQSIIELAEDHAMLAGIEKMKEQMMTKAIDGIARPDDGEIWCDLKSFNFKDGDKVKVIVIKED